jgi:hypothetical protein
LHDRVAATERLGHGRAKQGTCVHGVSRIPIS